MSKKKRKIQAKNNKDEFITIPESGTVVILDKSLPIPETMRCCCVETKKEFNIATGGFVDIFRFGKQNKFFASQKVFNKLKSELNLK